MENQQELFELFMHNNMLPEPFDPDKVLAAGARGGTGLSAVRTIYKRHGQAAAKVQTAGEEGYCQEVLLQKRGTSGCRCVFSDRVLPGGCTSQ